MNLRFIALILVIVGGLNWGLMAFDFNLVTFLFERISTMLVNVVYILVGLSAIYLLATINK